MELKSSSFLRYWEYSKRRMKNKQQREVQQKQYTSTFRHLIVINQGYQSFLHIQ